MPKKKDENLIWNAHVKQVRLEGEQVISAFETLRQIYEKAQKPGAVQALIGKEDWKPPEEVKIPMWALKPLVEAWCQYEGTKDSPTLGQIFGLEGKGQGKRKSLGQHKRIDKEVNAAVRVTSLIENGLSKTKAIGIAAEECGITSDALKKALASPNQGKS